MRCASASNGPLWKRGSCALLLALLLLGGALEIHPRNEAPHEAGYRAGEGYAPEAIHPREAHHFEAGSIVRAPDCPACLLHLLNAGAHTPEPIGLVPTVAVSLLPPGALRGAGRLVVADGAARAPPRV